MAVDLRALTPPDWVVERRSELAVQGGEVREYSEDWLAPLIEFARRSFTKTGRDSCAPPPKTSSEAGGTTG